MSAPGRPVPVVSGTDILLVLLRRWRLFAMVGSATGVAAVAIALSLPLRYTSSVVLLPENQPDNPVLPSVLSGVAAQFGISTGGAGAQSAALYAAVLTSRRMAEALLTTEFAVPGDTARGPLWRWLRYNDVENAIAAFGRIVTVSTATRTNLVTVHVTTGLPWLSLAAAQRLVVLVNEFNTSMRQLNARQRRVFTEQRAREADSTLRAAEGELRHFLSSNRDFAGSPGLRFEHDRLQRQVRLREELALALLRQLDESRIAEVNDIPTVTVVDPPVEPRRKSGPQRSLVVLGLEFGALLAVALTVLGGEAWARLRQRHPELVATMWSALRRTGT